MNKNIGPFLAFNKEWFKKNQKGLLWLLNSKFTKRLFRWVLRIRKDDIGYNELIVRLLPNAYTVFQGYNEGRIKLVSDFRTHPKFAKRLYFAFWPFWWLLHFWDWLVADKFISKWSFGLLTLTAYPDASPGTTTVDGYVRRAPVPAEDYPTIRTGAGTINDYTSDPTLNAQILCNASANYNRNSRGIFLFDTSAIGNTATINAATLSFYGFSNPDGITTMTAAQKALAVVGTTPASNTALANADYGQFGATRYNTTDYAHASWSTTAYNDIAFNATGLSNVSKTGISKFGTMFAVDLDAGDPGFVASAETSLLCKSADAAGTANDPKLVVTYTLPASAGASFLLKMI